ECVSIVDIEREQIAEETCLAANRHHLCRRLAAVQAQFGSIGIEDARDVIAFPREGHDAPGFGAVRAQRDRLPGGHKRGERHESRQSSALMSQSRVRLLLCVALLRPELQLRARFTLHRADAEIQIAAREGLAIDRLKYN